MKLIKSLESMSLGRITFMCLLLYITGFVWFFLLSQDEFSHKTYMSENALLTGLVESEFVDHAYTKEVLKKMQQLPMKENSNALKDFLYNEMVHLGLDAAFHSFSLDFDQFLGQNFTGENLYGVVRSIGIARTEALVIHAPFRDVTAHEQESPLASFAVMLGIAKHTRGLTYWAKDVVILFTELEYVGLQAWLDACHGQQTSPNIHSKYLDFNIGSIQAAISLDHSTKTKTLIDLHLPGLNGIMPNLDLVNNFVRHAGILDISISIHGMESPVYYGEPSWTQRLKRVWHMGRLMQAQASGSPSGLHGLFLAMEIPSVSVISNSMSDMALRKLAILMETVLRSLNNLEERLHQSFFFYLLPSTHHYVSIGMYMAPFGCILVALAIQILHLWFSYRLETKDKPQTDEVHTSWMFFMVHFLLAASLTFLAKIFPLSSLRMAQLFNMEPAQALFTGLASISTCAFAYTNVLKKKSQLQIMMLDWRLVKCFLLLLFAVILGCVAVVNISMATFLAFFVVPVLILVFPTNYRLVYYIQCALILMLSPLVLCFIGETLLHPLTTAVNELKLFCMFAFVEQELLKSWTLGIGTIVLFPAFCLLWGLAPLKSNAPS